MKTYRLVRVKLPTRRYYTVQLADGAPYGPEGAEIKVVRSGLSLQAAIEQRDQRNKWAEEDREDSADGR